MKYSESLKGYDKIRKWIFLTEPFSQVSLSPSLFPHPAPPSFLLIILSPAGE
jgi:hypothetical protein